MDESTRRFFRVLASNDVNVCGHLGLQPQLVIDSSDYKIQGRDNNSSELIMSDAILLESLGISLLVLECVPSDFSQKM